MTARLPAQSEPRVESLANGVRVVTSFLPHLDSASVSIFVRTGSAHERHAMSGISHVVEHMAFKGTATRDCQTDQPGCRAPRRRGQRAHRQGPHRVPHARAGARRGALRANAGRHRAERQLSAGRAGARAPGDPAGAGRGRRRRVRDGLPAVRQGLLRQPPARAAGDRAAPQHRALHARRPGGLRAAAAVGRQRGGRRGRAHRRGRDRARSRGGFRRDGSRQREPGRAAGLAWGLRRAAHGGRQPVARGVRLPGAAVDRRRASRGASWPRHCSARG